MGDDGTYSHDMGMILQRRKDQWYQKDCIMEGKKPLRDNIKNQLWAFFFHIQYYISSVQHSDLTVIYIIKWSPNKCSCCQHRKIYY